MRNRILDALPPADFNRLAPLLTRVSFHFKEVVQKQGEPVKYVYFPIGGVCAVVATVSTGAMVEVAAIGDEGIVGIEAYLSERPLAYGDRLIQVPDAAERVTVHDFRQYAETSPALRAIVGRYAEAKVAEFVQSAACNALHNMQQRCARWLLETHDRVHRDEFVLSHEFLAMMLGANRSTISLTAAALQDAGLIRYRYGRVQVLNRGGLERASCECYALIRERYTQRTSPTARR